MEIEWVRNYCLSLPHTTETMQWGNDLVFKIGGKMYAVVSVEPAANWMSFKCTPEKFAELIERPGIIPAPYLARAHWVALEDSKTLPRAEVKGHLRDAYQLIFEKLPRKTQGQFRSPGS